jgi:protein-L-isoaspartate(D-aspartate) O-methyltransferase
MAFPAAQASGEGGMVDFESARRAMVDSQVRPSDVTRLPIIEAMLRVPRERFTPKAHRPVAYADAQIPLAPRRVLLDARTFAKMIDAADIAPGDLVLDVGAGWGYSAAVVSRLAAAVVALEELPEAAAAASDLLAALEADNVIVERGPLAEGAAASGPYDVILIEGGVERVPEALTAQLKDGGRLVAIEVAGPVGRCTVWTRAGDALSARRAFDAMAPVLPGFDVAPAFTL